MRIAVDLIVGGRLAVRTPIGEGVMTLGASQSSDLCLPHEGVDSTHLVFHRRGVKLSCSNRSSKPFSVNGEEIAESVRLADGDKVTFGPVTLKFRFVAEEVGQATATMMHGRGGEG